MIFQHCPERIHGQDYKIEQLMMPTPKLLQPLAMKRVAPGSCDPEKVMENFLTMKLYCCDYLREARAVNHELGEQWVLRIGILIYNSLNWLKAKRNL